MENIIKEFQQSINELNSVFFPYILDYHKNELSMIKEQENVLKSNLEQLENMKQDVIKNFDHIVEKIDDKKYHEVMGFFKQKMQLIEKQNDYLDSKNVFLWNEHKADKVLSDFKSMYKKILLQICPIPFNQISIPNQILEQHEEKRDV